ncbi:MAG TPA: cupin domain-containing protein [Actinomycetota bacterium]|nr:cupin domain-containing protein [Actinomycetota bacterium]
MSTIRVIADGARAWRSLTNPPGRIPSPGAEADVFATPDGAFTTGFWEREPDTWSFERPYHEVALILAGEADIETDGGVVHSVRAGDVLITPKGSAGTWRIKEKIVKFYAISAEPTDRSD